MCSALSVSNEGVVDGWDVSEAWWLMDWQWVAAPCVVDSSNLNKIKHAFYHHKPQSMHMTTLR